MKRDMELVRQILLVIEDNEAGYAPPNISMTDSSEEEIKYHAFIMKEAGLIEGIDVSHLQSRTPQAIPTRLTWKGHEFLDNARDETVWKKAMDVVKDKGGAISIGVLTQLLSSLAKSHFGLP